MTPAQEKYKRRIEILMYQAMAKQEDVQRELQHANRLVKRYEFMLEDLEYTVERAERK